MSKEKDEVLYQSPQSTKEGKEELYLYSKKKITDINAPENYNSLTNLPNLRLFFYQTGEVINDNPDDKFGVIVMDITLFKAVNEFCGRSEGDRLLKHIGDCFRKYTIEREKTYAAHIRADNFCLFTTYEDERELADIVVEIKTSIQNLPFAYRVIPSFGICASTESQPAVNYLKDCATIALSSIKGKFYADYKFFDAKMRTKLMKEKQIESDIVSAIENGELVPYIQPKVNMLTGKIIGGEALARWISPQKGMICPGEFIPVLEKSGFVINVDECIWKRVFEYLGGLIKSGREAVPISINISRMHVYDNDLCSTIFGLKDKYKVPAVFTPLELTESAFLTDEEGMFYRMKLLKAQGFIISMDDFGTGYSTMNMLKSQPVDEVKIDREFIIDIEDNKSQIILRHTLAMLQELKTKIIVEGVETEAQKNFLVDNNCFNAQGFMFYRPMPIAEFDELLKKQEENKGGN